MYETAIFTLFIGDNPERSHKSTISQAAPILIRSFTAMQRLSPLIQRSSACLQPLQLSTRPTFFSTSTGPISARPSATPGINPVSLKTPPTAGSEVTDLTRIEASNPEYFHRTITARLREPSKRARNKVRKSGWYVSPTLDPTAIIHNYDFQVLTHTHPYCYHYVSIITNQDTISVSRAW